MGLLTCVQNQIPDSIPETNPLDVPLDDIAENLLSFLNESKSLSKAEKVIENKYEIKKEDGDCWPADDIKRVWRETQSMKIKSRRRRYWAHVIILQMLKRFMVYDERKPNAAQKDHDDTTNDMNKSCETRSGMKENSEDTSSQGREELQMWKADLHAVKHKLTEQYRALLESHLSAPITDVATSPAELRGEICYAHTRSSESMNAAMVNENGDTLDNSCELPKSIDNCEELNFTDTPDRMKAESENEREEDGLWSTDDINQACGKAETMKGNSDRSSQSSAELKTVGAAGGAKQSSGANRKSVKSEPTRSASKNQSRAKYSAGSQATEKDPGPPADQSGTDGTASKKGETICICIPFSEMFNSSLSDSQHVTHRASRYKLINGNPSDTDLSIRRSYAMSFDTETMNAKFVYEILNRNTLVNNCQQRSFGHGYVKGHLAAAANHRWCQEAFDETNMSSNMIPQNSVLNNRTWKKLEYHCRDLSFHQGIKNVHVYTGPLYNFTDNLVLQWKRVPSHLFKVIIVENGNGTVKEPECYKMPNEEPQNTDLDFYRVDIGDIQRDSGLTFIERRPNQNMRDYTKSVILQREGENGVKIAVRISSIQ